MFHIFAICGYQESPYLERCIRSLKGQSVPANIILCTSTPNAFLKKTAARYQLPLYIREGESGICADWNFAYDTADAEYVTIAHQDDVYHRDYLKCMQKALNLYPDTLLAMTDYKILDAQNLVGSDVSLLIKQFLKLPLRIPAFADQAWAKWIALAFGNSICCPSVCYHKSILGSSIFQKGYDYALDWETFRVTGKLQGRFTYLPQTLFYYRIHGQNATQKYLKNREKTEEEMAMFRKFWPEWTVQMLMQAYRLSYKSYGRRRR